MLPPLHTEKEVFKYDYISMSEAFCKLKTNAGLIAQSLPVFLLIIRQTIEEKGDLSILYHVHSSISLTTCLVDQRLDIIDKVAIHIYYFVYH